MSVLGRSLADTALESLIAALAQGDLCLVVGAGGSIDLGAPGWRDLIERLAGTGSGARNLPENIGLPLLAELLIQVDDFTPLRGLFDQAVPCDWVENGVVSKGKQKRFDETALCFLARLAILLARRAPGRTFHVISYNFDTYLEEAIAHLGGRSEAITASAREEWRPRPGAFPEPGHRGRTAPTVRVVHPHGLVPRLSDRHHRRLPKDDLVFLASSYDERLLNPLSEPSIWQLVGYGYHRCLFYGFSFNDYAVRALLRHSANLGELREKAEKSWHVALMKEDSERSTNRRKGKGGSGSKRAPEAEKRAAWTWVLGELGIIRLATPDFDAHLRFLRLLLAEAEHRGLADSDQG